jgi:hypothetical protein
LPYKPILQELASRVEGVCKMFSNSGKKLLSKPNEMLVYNGGIFKN